MIVDASAILAYLLKEDDGFFFEEVLLSEDGPMTISAVNWWEVHAKVIATNEPEVTEGLDIFITATTLDFAPIDRTQTNGAIEAFRRFGKGLGHPAKLNLGDCFAYALAKSRNEPLLFKGNDFRHTDVRAAL